MADNLAIKSGVTQDIMSLHTFITKPEVKEKLYYSYEHDLTITDLMRYFMPDRELTVGSDTLEAQERNYFWGTIHVGSVTSYPASPGDPFVFTLDASQDIDSAGNVFVRTRQTLNIGDIAHKVRCWVSSVTGTSPTITVTAYPMNNETFTSTTVDVGDTIGLGAIAAGAESGPVDSTTTGFNKYNFYTQTLKEAFLAGDAEMATKNWVVAEGKGRWLLESAEKELALDLQKQDVAMWGKTTTNTAIKDTSGANSKLTKVTTSKGWWEWGTDFGYILNYSASTGMTVDDFNKVAEYSESKGISAGSYMALLGGDLYRLLQKNMKDYITGTTGSLSEAFTPKTGTAANNLQMHFQNLTLGPNTFSLINSSAFNNPYWAAYTGSGTKSCGLLMPIGMARDEKNGAQPNFSVRYRGVNGYIRNNVVSINGGTGGFAKQALGVPYNNHRYDFTSMDWLTELMFPIYQPWKIITIRAI